MTKPFRRGFGNRVGLIVGNALTPDQVQPSFLRERISLLLTSAGQAAPDLPA